MPPKRVAIQPARRQQKDASYISTVYNTLTSEENASVVISVALFGAAVTFLHSSFSDFLLPEL